MEISTIVDFIEASNPDVPVDPTLVNGSAQTGDMIGFWIAALFAIASLGMLTYLFVAKKKLCTVKPMHAKSTILNANNKMFVVVASIVCAFVLIASTLGIKAYASSVNEDINVTVTDKISCEVNKDTGATDMSKCVVSITNNGESPISFQKINLDLINGQQDLDSIWHIYNGQDEIYNDIANNYASITNGIYIKPNETTQLTFGLEMDSDTAKSYIGKSVAKISYEFIVWESTINGSILCQPDTFVSCVGSFTNKITGEVISFETDYQGKFTLKLPPETEGILSIDLVTDKGHYFYKNWQTSPGNRGQISFNRNLVGSSSDFSIATAGGTFNDIPEGWSKDGENEVIKAKWSNGNPVYLILNEIDPSIITPSSADNKFAKWNTNSGSHPPVNEVYPVWVNSSSIELTGNVADVNGKPVSGVNVDIYKGGNTSPEFSTNTDLDGAYSLFVNDAASYTIKFSTQPSTVPVYFAPNKNIEVSESKDLGITTVYEGLNILNRISNSDGSQYEYSDTAHVSFVDLDGQVLSEQDIYYDSYYSYPVYNFNIVKSGKGIIKHDMPDSYLDFIFDFTEQGTGTQKIVKNTKVYKVSESSTIKGSISPAKEGVQVSFRLSDGSEYVTTTKADGSYDLLVPPGQEGTFIVKDPELGTFYEKFNSGSTGEIKYKDKNMNEKYLVTVDLGNGHISPAGVPEGWTKLSSVRYEKIFVAGSTFSYIMGGWDTKLITHPDPLYAFAAWDVNMDAPLQSAKTVTALYGGFFRYETVSGVTTQESGNLGKAKYKSIVDESVFFKSHAEKKFSRCVVSVWSPDGSEEYGSVEFKANEDFESRTMTMFKFKYITEESEKFILEHLLYYPLTIVPEGVTTITDAIPVYFNPTEAGLEFNAEQIQKLKDVGFAEHTIGGGTYYSKLFAPDITIAEVFADLQKLDVLPEGATEWTVNGHDYNYYKSMYQLNMEVSQIYSGSSNKFEMYPKIS